MPEIRLDGEPVTTWIPQPDTVTGMTPTPNPRRRDITGTLALGALAVAITLGTIQAVANLTWPTGEAWWYSAGTQVVASIATSVYWWIATMWLRTQRRGGAQA
jgi:hypothetical protein